MTDNHQFDENLKRMLKSAFDRPSPAFQDNLVRDVLDEVARQRQLEATPSWWRTLLAGPVWRPVGLATAAASLLVAGGLWLRSSLSAPLVGRVSCLYGLVAVQNGGTPETVQGAVELKSGQRVRTQAGSKAQIQFEDQSRLIPDPRTSLQVTATRRGPRVLLEQGALRLEAAKQLPGKAITIDASHAHVKVLGTKLDVRLVDKPDGRRQTRVRVLNGSVEMESGGQKVVLPAGTEGIADEGQPPVRSAVVFEVNELIGLMNQTATAAAPSNRLSGVPAIIDFTTATVWCVVPGSRLHPTGPGTLTLGLKYPAFAARAYTLEGAEIPATGTGDVLSLDLSPFAGSQMPAYVILKVPGVGGLARTTADARYTCAYPPGDNGQLALFQLYLPASARIESVEPAVVQTTIARDKLIITLAADLRLPQLYE